MVAEVEAVYRSLGYCVVVLCENQPDESVRCWAPAARRAGPTRSVTPTTTAPRSTWRRLRQHLGVRTGWTSRGTLQRMSIAHQSSSDRQEAELAGELAVELALVGRSDLMVTLTRETNQPYRCGTATAPLAGIANLQRLLPDEFIAETGAASPMCSASTPCRCLATHCRSTLRSTEALMGRAQRQASFRRDEEFGLLAPPGHPEEPKDQPVLRARLFSTGLPIPADPSVPQDDREGDRTVTLNPPDLNPSPG